MDLPSIRRVPGVLGKSACEIEDLGEFIRESIDEWVRVKKDKSEETPKK